MVTVLTAFCISVILDRMGLRDVMSRIQLKISKALSQQKATVPDMCKMCHNAAHIQGVFFTGPPPKKLKYGKPRLGEFRCI